MTGTNELIGLILSKIRKLSSVRELLLSQWTFSDRLEDIFVMSCPTVSHFLFYAGFLSNNRQQCVDWSNTKGIWNSLNTNGYGCMGELSSAALRKFQSVRLSHFSSSAGFFPNDRQQRVN
jgi:hypothetical protein